MVTWVGEREVSGIPEAAWLCGGVAGCRTYARAGGGRRWRMADETHAQGGQGACEILVLVWRRLV